MMEINHENDGDQSSSQQKQVYQLPMQNFPYSSGSLALDDFAVQGLGVLLLCPNYLLLESLRLHHCHKFRAPD